MRCKPPVRDVGTGYLVVSAEIHLLNTLFQRFILRPVYSIVSLELSIVGIRGVSNSIDR